MSGFLTETEVSKRTHISLGTLRRWRLENKGPRYRKFGWLVRYLEADLKDWEEAQPGGGSGVPRIGPTAVRPSSALRKSG
jgi:predicted DNA-binding transcriptional regulator AlpA